MTIFQWKLPDRATAKKRLIIIFSPLAVILCVMLILYVTGIRINTTPSLPVGVWWMTKVNSELLEIGDSVMIDKSAVPNASRHLLKDIAALQGDTISSDGVFVYRNGLKIPLSEIHKADSRGRTVVRVSYPLTVPPRFVWLSSRHNRGYDSRYFGPVPISAVIGEAVLLWAW